MKQTDAPIWTTRLFALLLRRRDRETILGDLVEERALLSASMTAGDAARWYRDQVLRSVAPVVWANIRRGGWLKTLGAAIAGYLAVMALVMTSDIALSKVLAVSEDIYSLVSLAVGFVVMVLGGYLAAWMRPRGAVVLAALAGLLGIISLAGAQDGAPIWYQLGLIAAGPAGALAGGQIRLRGKEAPHL